MERALGDLEKLGRAERRVIGLPTILQPGDLESGQRALVDTLVRRSLETKPGARVVLEKTPSNSLCVDLISRVCPDARLLHIVRDPRDVMASLRDAARGWGADWAPASSAAAARMWLQHYDGARTAVACGDRYMELRYEDLRKDPEKLLSRVLDFLGLPDPPSAAGE